MPEVAKISFEGGARLMPAQNQYDRELVFEEAEFFARRHGRVTLEFDRTAMQICITADEDACAKCRKPLAGMRFACGEWLLCRRCARRTAG